MISWHRQVGWFGCWWYQLIYPSSHCQASMVQEGLLVSSSLPELGAQTTTPYDWCRRCSPPSYAIVAGWYFGEPPCLDHLASCFLLLECNQWLHWPRFLSSWRRRHCTATLHRPQHIFIEFLKVVAWGTTLEPRCWSSIHGTNFSYLFHVRCHL